MANEQSWVEDLKGAAAALAVPALITSGVAGLAAENNMHLADPVADSALQTTAALGDALEETIGARAGSDMVADATDVTPSQGRSLDVEPPSWIAEPTELQQSVTEDIGLLGAPSDGVAGGGIF